MRINTHVGSVHIKIDTSRLDKNLKKAQQKLDQDVLNDTNHYFSKGGTGFLRESGHIVEGGGAVEWTAPYSHFQYVGFVRTDENGRVFVGKDEKKPILTDRPLQYREPQAEREPFEAAKRDHLQDWIKDVKEEIGKE